MIGHKGVYRGFYKLYEFKAVLLSYRLQFFAACITKRADDSNIMITVAAETPLDKITDIPFDQACRISVISVFIYKTGEGGYKP